MSSVIQVTSVSYPESDGKPMGETDQHRKEMIREIELLDDSSRVNKCTYRETCSCITSGAIPRSSWCRTCSWSWAWSPGIGGSTSCGSSTKRPNVVIEVTSRKTKKKDTVTKPALYRPTGDWRVFPVRSHGGLPGPAAARQSAGGRRVRTPLRRRGGRAGQSRTRTAAAGEGRTADVLSLGHGRAAVDGRGSAAGCRSRGRPLTRGIAPPTQRASVRSAIRETCGRRFRETCVERGVGRPGASTVASRALRHSPHRKAPSTLRPPLLRTLSPSWLLPAAPAVRPGRGTR